MMSLRDSSREHKEQCVCLEEHLGCPRHVGVVGVSAVCAGRLRGLTLRAPGRRSIGKPLTSLAAFGYDRCVPFTAVQEVA
jgi:hypothetical protein